MSITFNAFVALPLRFCSHAGLTAYRVVHNGKPSAIPIWKTIQFVLGSLNIVIMCLAELRVLPTIECFPVVVETVLYCCFLCLYMVKVCTLIFARPLFTWLMSELTALFPKTHAEHVECRTEVYLQKVLRIMMVYAWVQLIMVWLYNLNSLILAVYGYATLGEWHMDLPYSSQFYPFEVTSAVVFVLCWCQQVSAGYISGAGILAADLLLCSVSVQINMQFDRLTKRLRRLKTKGGQGALNDYKELRECIVLHNRLIKMAEAVNELFGICIFINVASASIMLCVDGFSIIINEDPMAKMKFALSLIVSSIQMFLISLLGEMFIDASIGVANAAWECEWIEGTQQYRMALLLIMVRAQRPQYLKAFKFLNTSMQMFTDVMSMSWKFFALLLEVYSE